MIVADPRRIALAGACRLLVAAAARHQRGRCSTDWRM